jgi:hypothetical protein
VEVTVPSVCSTCAHYRLEPVPDPFVGLRLVSPKILELRTKWQQELATQAELEEQVYLSGHGFDFKPIAYPWCNKFSDAAVTDPITGAVRRIYALCVEKNPDGECTGYEPSHG